MNYWEQTKSTPISLCGIKFWEGISFLYIVGNSRFNFKSRWKVFIEGEFGEIGDLKVINEHKFNQILSESEDWVVTSFEKSAVFTNRVVRTFCTVLIRLVLYFVIQWPYKY